MCVCIYIASLHVKIGKPVRALLIIFLGAFFSLFFLRFSNCTYIRIRRPDG